MLVHSKNIRIKDKKELKNDDCGDTIELTRLESNWNLQTLPWNCCWKTYSKNIISENRKNWAHAWWISNHTLQLPIGADNLCVMCFWDYHYVNINIQCHCFPMFVITIGNFFIFMSFILFHFLFVAVFLWFFCFLCAVVVSVIQIFQRSVMKAIVCVNVQII